MSNYLYRLAHFAFRRRRLVLAIWLAAAIAAIAIAVASGGKTNDNFTIPGTEAQNAAAVLSAKLPAFSGGQSTIVFATTNGTTRRSPTAADQGGDRVGHEQAQVDSAGLRRRESLPEPSWCRPSGTDRARAGAVVGAGGRREGRQPQRRQGRDEAGAGRRRAGRVQRQRLSRAGARPSPRRPS